MGATSVTGVGVGSAESANKGAQGRQTLGVTHLIGPHVVAAGVVTLSGGAATVNIPLIASSLTGYMVLATDQTANHSVCAVMTNNASDTQIVFTGTSTDVIGWAVLSTGLGGINS